MAYGGGTFVFQNKTLPGAYINFVSAARASATLSDRGYATMPLELDWGKDDEVFEVTNGDFQKNSMELFGYDYTHEKLKGLRDLFQYCKTLYAYRLNSGGEKATCSLATAKYSGVRGNDLKIVIAANVDDESAFDVKTMLGASVVDEQTVTAFSELVDNPYIVWKASGTLEATPGVPLTGGTNAEITGKNHQDYLDAIESYTFNTMGVDTTDNTIQNLYVSFVKRMRDEVGVKFQLVLYNKKADYMGVINVKNTVNDEGASPASLVYWVTGASAGCEVNKSNQNKVYNGEFIVNTKYTQTELTKAIKQGEFTFHKVGDDARVLDDINSFVNVTDDQGDVFCDNQVVRVCDQIGNDIAVMFNTRFLGTTPNDKAGRTSLWACIVKHHQQLQDVRAIEDFEDDDIVVEQGDSKKAVVVRDAVTVTVAMGKLYMTVTVA